MKVIDVPKPVKVKLLAKKADNIVEEVEQKITFSEFLIGACEGYKEFAKGPQMARQYNKIMDVVESANGAKSIQFEDEDFKVVKGAVDSASWNTPNINRSYIPFYDAVDSAEDVKIPGKAKKK